MKKVVVSILAAMFIAFSGVGEALEDSTTVAALAQDKKRDDKKEKKAPPGPPVVRDKEPKGKGEPDKPKKDKKPDTGQAG
jgi:hypothetical protein